MEEGRGGAVLSPETFSDGSRRGEVREGTSPSRDDSWLSGNDTWQEKDEQRAQSVL